MALPPGMLPEIEPVSRESTAAVIARQLRDAIMTGALPPGTQLGETELAVPVPGVTGAAPGSHAASGFRRTPAQ